MAKAKKDKLEPETEGKKMIKVSQETLGRVMVEPGFYTFKVTAMTKKESRSSDAENAVMTAVVTKAEDDAMLGKRVIDNFPLLEQSLWRIDLFYQACMGESLPEGDYSEDDLMELLKETVGTEFSAEAVIEEYQGRDRARLQNFSA